MKKIIPLLLFVTALCAQVNAQGYNYMGKHVLFNANVSISPSWINPNPMSQHLSNLPSSAKKYLGLNYWVTPSIEAIVWSKGAIGAGYNFYKSPFKGRASYYDDYYFNYSYRDYNGMITAHGFNVFYKQYLGQTFAPLGSYLKFNFDGFFYHYITDDAQEGKDKLFGAKVEYGYDFLLFDRMRLSVGASIGSTFGGIRLAFKQMTKDDYDMSAMTVNNYVNARMFMAYWFGIKLGIGFLAF